MEKRYIILLNENLCLVLRTWRRKLMKRVTAHKIGDKSETLRGIKSLKREALNNPESNIRYIWTFNWKQANSPGKLEKIITIKISRYVHDTNTKIQYRFNGEPVISKAESKVMLSSGIKRLEYSDFL